MESNSTSEENFDWYTVMEPYLYGPIDVYAMFIAVPIIVIIGIVGNVSTIIVLSTKNMRNSLNIYLVNLAISDGLFLLIAPTYTWITFFESPLHHNYDNSWFTIEYCKFYTFIVHTSYQLSCIFMVAISVERFLATTRPLKYRAYVSKKRTMKICCAIWVSTLFYQGRNIVTIGERPLELPWPDMTNGVTNSTTLCTLCVGFHPVICEIMDYLYVLDLCLVLSAIIFIILMYGTLFCSLRGPFSKSTQVSSASNRTNYEMKALRTVIITVSAYILLTTPLNSLLLFYQLGFVDANVVDLVENAFRFISLINSANNPIIYNVTNKTYRQAFWGLIGISRSKKQKSSSSSDQHQNASLALSITSESSTVSRTIETN